MMCRDKSELDDDPGDVVHDGHGGQDGGGELFGLNGGGGARVSRGQTILLFIQSYPSNFQYFLYILTNFKLSLWIIN